MLDTLTKRRIDTARDILVGKLPDPKSQVEQITIALIYKFMDDMDKQSEELGGKATFFTGEYEKYAWSRIFDPRVSGYELVGLYGEAIQKMNHNPNIPQLFRDIFKNAYLPYRDPETLKMFLKVIGEFEYDHSEKLGDAFEYLLSIMGSQGDAGQFRTPRHIIDFMVKVVDPCKNETILDPACGTAGFLISSFNHIQNKNKKDGRINLTADERTRLINNFSGYDISPDMVRLSLVNMYLHKFPAPKIYEYDTLTSEDKWNEVFDVILANPPFMSPKGGIKPHKRFSVQAKRSEVLFVDYIAEHLNPNGRAGIIVPEGIIFQSGNAYKKLRKMLIENSLYVVVSLPAGVFNPYSGVKTSILFLNKNISKKTDRILFVKVSHDGFGLGAQRRKIKENDLPPALEIIKKYKQSIIEGEEIEFNLNENKIAHVVKKEKIAESGDYNLTGDRYKEAVVYNGKWETVFLGDVVDILDKRRKPVKKGDRKKGPYPYYGATGILDHVNDFIFDERLVLVGEDGAKWGKGEKTSFIIQGKCWVNNHAHVLRAKKNKIIDIFLINLLNEMDLSYHITGVTVPKLNQQKLREIKIPLPPLEIQEQIVAELDSYQKIIDGAKQVVENYKPTFKIDPEWKTVKLAKVSKIISGYSFNSKDFSKNNPVKCVKITNVGVREFIEINDSNLPQDFKRKYFDSLVKSGDIVISLTRPIISSGLKVALTPASFNDSLLNQRVAAIRNVENISNIKFIYYMLCSPFVYDYVLEKSRSLMQPNLSINDLKSLEIPCPSLKTQKNIVAKIEREQKAIDANKELIMIFENKIKDKIADVWGE